MLEIQGSWEKNESGPGSIAGQAKNKDMSKEEFKAIIQPQNDQLIEEEKVQAIKIEDQNKRLKTDLKQSKHDYRPYFIIKNSGGHLRINVRFES